MTTVSGVSRWPGESEECHPGIFTTIPSQPETLKPGQLSPQQIQQYFEEGYVVIDSFFDTNLELEPVKADIENLVEELANKLLNAGKITDTHSDLGLFQRLTALEHDFPGTNIILVKQGSLTTHLRALWSNDRLLNVAEQLLGTSDIQGHPVWNLRTKTPQNEATTVPWHQDVAYLDNDSYTVHQVTAWIPLLDAVEKNGCLQMIRGGHRPGKVAKHQCCHGGTWYVMLEEDEMEKTLGVDMKRDVVTCPVPYGGLVLFNNMIPHRSLNNQSDSVRWSLDLRWQSSKQPVGFYGLKQGVVLRSSTDPHLNIDWDTFDGVDRHKEAAKALEQETQELDTSVPGPWMKKWEIVHVNRHVEAMLQDSGKVNSWHGIKA